ncbi:MAG TPA: hypothetical protein VHR35_01575 [Nocardioides sp.]|jgi:hypothetical protein|nr:hypothetical protein [Nocardioides sp.]
MKLFAVLLGTLALLAGFAGGMRAYSVSAATPPAPPLVIAKHHPAPQPVRPGVVVRWAPCRKPAVLEGKTCVTHVTRTVTVPAPAVAAAPVAPAAAPQAPPTRAANPAPAPTQPSYEGGHDDGGHEHEGGGGGGEHDD